MPGLPRKYAKMGFKKGWKAFRKAHPKRGAKASTKTKRNVKKVARRRSYSRKRRRRAKKTIPILPIAGLAAGLWEPVSNMVADPSPENIHTSLNHIVASYSGFNVIEGEFQPMMLYKGLMPLVAGLIAHKVAGAMGANKIFANLPSPFDRLRL